MNRKSEPAKELALVLRTIRHGETSRIATLFAPKLGKIAVLAKGARSGKSGSVGGALDTPSLIEAVVYIKPSRSVQLLGQTTVVESFVNLKADVARTAYSAVVSELILKGFTDDEANPSAFAATLKTLNNLDQGRYSEKFSLIEFLLNFSDAMGFGVDPFTCPVCGSTPGKTALINRFYWDTGAICCASCESSNLEYERISGESVGILRLFKRGNINLERIKVSDAAQNELVSLLMKHLRWHHPAFNQLPSYRMLGQLTAE